jgi:hypothetical protein
MVRDLEHPERDADALNLTIPEDVAEWLLHHLANGTQCLLSPDAGAKSAGLARIRAIIAATKRHMERRPNSVR